jgi:beta-lactamase superfamily II metal-dependent hydrolase
VGHHGSKTSSRTSFLDAVGATTFIVSSGPIKYGSVTLLEAEIITELQNREKVYRTDHNDSSCGTNNAKIGTDYDGKPGGCDNIHIVILSDGSFRADYWLEAD